MASAIHGSLKTLSNALSWAWLDTVCLYRRSRIGPLWETLNVLVMLLGLSVVSSAIFGSSVSDIIAYVGVGIIVWSAVSALVIEGGGVFVIGGRGVAHFLFADGEAARRALESAGIRVVAAREVLVQRLRQGEPGQLGKLARRMAAAGVNIEVQYSDHDHQLILVVDDLEKGREVSRAWMSEKSA